MKDRMQLVAASTGSGLVVGHFIGLLTVVFVALALFGVMVVLSRFGDRHA